MPTIAGLLGIPIPFGNIGRIISELFFEYPEPHIDMEYVGKLSAPEKMTFLKKITIANRALRTNCWQIRNYITKYSEHSGQFPEYKLTEINFPFDEAEKIFSDITKKGSGEILDEVEIFKNFRTYHVLASELCRDLWTSFDTDSMNIGVILLLLSLVWLGYAIYRNPEWKSGFRVSPENIVALGLLVFRCLGLLSNSYIESEEKVLHFFLITMSILYSVKSLQVIMPIICLNSPDPELRYNICDRPTFVRISKFTRNWR